MKVGRIDWVRALALLAEARDALVDELRAAGPLAEDPHPTLMAHSRTVEKSNRFLVRMGRMDERKPERKSKS